MPVKICWKGQCITCTLETRDVAFGQEPVVQGYDSGAGSSGTYGISQRSTFRNSVEDDLVLFASEKSFHDDPLTSSIPHIPPSGTLKRKADDVEVAKSKSWLVPVVAAPTAKEPVPSNTLSMELPALQTLMESMANLQKTLEKNKECILCNIFQANQQSAHSSPNFCPTVKKMNLCFHCFGTCRGSSCTLKSFMTLPYKVCYMCGLADSIHYQQNGDQWILVPLYVKGAKCTAMAKDMVFPLIWYARRRKDSLKRVNTRFNLKTDMTDEEYRIWLYQSNQSPPMPNYLLVFGFLINHDDIVTD